MVPRVSRRRFGGEVECEWRGLAVWVGQFGDVKEVKEMRDDGKDEP